MKLPPYSRQVFTIAAWLAMAVIAYCIGRMTAPTEKAVVAGPTTGNSAASAAAQPSVDTQVASTMSPEELQRISESGPTTLEKLTGGRPMGDWLKNLLAQEDEIIRTTGFLKLLENLKTPEDIMAALEVVKGRDGGDGGRRGGGRFGNREFSMLMQKFTQMDPKAAIAYAEKAEGNERLAATATVLRTWARTSADEALAWAQTNGKTENEQDGNWAVAMVVSQLAKNNIDRALLVANEQPATRARGRMIDTLVSELVDQRGKEAAREAIMNMPDGTLKDSLTAQIAGRLAKGDGASTAQWVMNLPAGDARNRALVETVGEWSEEDPVGAGNFLTKLPASPETDAVRERYAYEVNRQDPEGSIAWASTISQDQQRYRAIENLVRNWMRRDTNQAQQWLAQSELPPEIKARFAPRPGEAQRGDRGPGGAGGPQGGRGGGFRGR